MTAGDRSRSREWRGGHRRALSVARRAAVLATGALALWGVAPALASTRVGWRVNGAPLNETSVATHWKGTLTLSDSKVPVVGASAAKCEDTAEGLAESGGAGEVTSLTASGCAAVKGCESGHEVTVEALHLPWHTELVATEGSLREVLTSGGKGAPGFKLKCRALGVQLQDECTGTLSASTTNNASGVTAAFSASEKFSCTSGGAGSGTLEGSQTIEASGGKLSAEIEEPPVWLRNGVSLGSAKAIAWTGTLRLSDSLPVIGRVGVKCQGAGSGSAGPGYGGEITKWTASECVSTEKCESAMAIEALHLPWHTELAFVEGTVRELITGSGKGMPGFKLKCKALGETVEDECLRVPLATLTNTVSGVTAALDGEKISCTEGHAAAGEFEGSQAIKLTEGGLLEVS
jgi:hypothetical protein